MFMSRQYCRSDESLSHYVKVSELTFYTGKTIFKNHLQLLFPTKTSADKKQDGGGRTESTTYLEPGGPGHRAPGRADNVGS